jgi:Translation initiation factor IF-2, N-terminal region/STAS-like domain of unknown function (DUF4325)
MRKVIRINDLARELEVKSKSILDALPLVGVTQKKNHSSSIELEEADLVRAYLLRYPEKSRAGARADSIKGAIDLSHISHPGDVLRAMRADATPARTAEEGPKPALITSLSPSVNGDLRRVVPPVVTATNISLLESSQDTGLTLKLPESFSFYSRGFVDFDHVMQYFDWSIRGSLTIDLTNCESSNFQALALLVQYAWYLTLEGCVVTFKYGTAYSGLTRMLTGMGALDWREVLLNDGRDFGNNPGKKTYALRRRSDVQSTINNARRAIRNYSIGFPEYLSYIISELLYNATEHGRRIAVTDNCHVLVPAVFQFGLYPRLNRLSFLFSDLGIGIKTHLEQSYPPFPSDQEAIIYALRPNVSGTFQQQSQPYGTRDNAGMGLTYSSLMLKRLRGDMYIVSHSGMVHVSPEDVASRQLRSYWPGTFVLINLNVESAPSVSLEDLMTEIRTSAQKELDGASLEEESDRYFVSIFNYFGKYAEDKDAAIMFRDRRLMPAIESGKKIDLDFRDVETAPHSFLNALLATPIRRLGIKAYQWIRVYNAPGPVHQIISKVLEDNLPRMR